MTVFVRTHGRFLTHYASRKTIFTADLDFTKFSTVLHILHYKCIIFDSCVFQLQEEAMVRMRYVFYTIVLTIILLILALSTACGHQLPFDTSPASSDHEESSQADNDDGNGNFVLFDYMNVETMSA